MNRITGPKGAEGLPAGDLSKANATYYMASRSAPENPTAPTRTPELAGDALVCVKLLTVAYRG